MKSFEIAGLPPDEVSRFVGGEHSGPFRVLGPHRVGDDLEIRVFRPDARKIEIVLDQHPEEPIAAQKIQQDGFFCATGRNTTRDLPYHLRVTAWHGSHYLTRDPYQYGTIMGEVDLHLFAEGQHWKIYDKFGAHVRTIGDASGVYFSVWAPNALRVSVVGDFNGWDGRVDPMRKLIGSGVWELFLPGIKQGAHYKFEIRTQTGALLLKSDPFAFVNQHGKSTASLVYDLERYTWNDGAWMESRRTRNWPRSPISIYEVHLGSWRCKTEEGNRHLSYLEFAETLLPYVLEMGYTHIELLPVAEHPFEGSWGYQVTNYYAPTSRFGTPDELRHFINACHQAGIGVIMDWVPAHFPKDAHALAEFDGTDLYEHMDPRQGEHQDWGTLIFNYGRNEVRNFLIGNALLWLDKYHIDGLRVDAVASMLYLDYSRKPGQWIPNVYGGRENLDAIYFLKRFNEVCYERFPGIITIAEESTDWPGVSRPTYLGGLGFGFKWNMGWMHDTLAYFHQDPIYRRYLHHELTFSLMYAFSENFILPLSHDEVVHGKGSLINKMPGDRWQKLANLRAMYAYMWAHPGKKLLFMGGELAQEAEWSHSRSLDWHLLERPDHAGIQSLVRDLNRLYRDEPALWEVDSDPSGFWWIEPNDADANVVAFARQSRDGERVLVFAANLSPVPREGYRLGLPRACRWREAINTDSTYYGGSDVGNLGGVEPEPIPWHGQPVSAEVTLRPLGARRLDAERVEFRVWAPRAREVSLQLRRRTFELFDAGGGVYEAVVPATAGEDYWFVLDGKRCPDPCSRWQPAGIRGPSRV